MARRNQARRTVPGSQRRPVPGARRISNVGAHETVDVTVRLRRNRPLNLERLLSKRARPLSRAELAKRYGARREDADIVQAFAQDHGLSVRNVNLVERSVALRGTAEAMQRAFGVKLTAYRTRHGVRYRQRQGGITVPLKVQGVIDGVFGLDDRPQARPQFRPRARPHAIREGDGSFCPTQLARLYEFPARASGRGECIALIELGGGYDPVEMMRYFKKRGLKAERSITSVSIDGAYNRYRGNPNGNDGEVALDIQVAGAVAPSASIAVYFAPNTDRGFLDAINAAIHHQATTVISISWGGPEQDSTPQWMHAVDDALQEAAVLGIPVFVAAGDDGSSDGVKSGRKWVDFPASAPHAIACGGTNLDADARGIIRETVWGPPDTDGGGATGGGFSRRFNRPAWQRRAVKRGVGRFKSAAMRGVPDVAAVADPDTGYQIVVAGHLRVFGGTSAVAPLWAGLVAACNSAKKRKRKRTGFLLPLLYSAPDAFRSITVGSNGKFNAAQGWDPCTGLGSPNGARLLKALW